MTQPETPANDSGRSADQGRVSLATSPAADASERSTTSAAPSGIQRAVFSSSLALVLGLVAITVAGMLWWQYRQFYVSLDSTDAAAALALERIRAEQRAQQDRLDDLRGDLDLLRQLNTSLGERVDALPRRFVELEQRLDAVQGGSFDARGTLLRSEAEYYLVVANTELGLAGHWENAITALELADGRLAELANPDFGPVREAIAGELLTLRGLRLPDIEGIVFSLGRLATRVESLPLRAELPVSYVDQGTVEPEAEPGFGRLWAALKRTLLGLVRIERRGEPVPQALSAAERLLGRRQLEVELELARIAAVRGQAQAFQASLDRAIDLLQRHFDVDAGEIEGALALLRELRGFAIDPPRPNISGSLGLLRATRDEAR